MAATFYIPTLGALLARIRAAFNAEVPGTDAFIWPNNVNPTGKVFGGALYELFGRVDYVRKQAFALTAEGEWLDMHGAEYNLPRKPPQSAMGAVAVTVSDAITIPNGTLFARSDGATYAVTADAGTSAAGTMSVPVLAVTPGKAGLAQPATPLTLLSGATGPGVLGAECAIDAAGMKGGLDTEPDGAPYTSDLGTYRGRILFRKRNPPMGGAASDYVIWAGQVPGVTRVFVERRYRGPGTVRVFPVFDDLFASTGGVPDAANVAAVQAIIEAEAPAGAAVVAAAAAAQLVDIEVDGLSPFSNAEQQAVAAELADTFRRVGLVAGADYAVPSMPYLATPQSFAALWVSQAVANAAGVKRAVVKSINDVAPADFAVAAASIPVLGQLTFPPA